MLNFSVVIPLYNKAEYIENTLNSVLNQSYQNFEIVVVDDGSTDKSIDIVEKVNDNRIRLIKQSNSGVSVARNTGIKHAKYDLIAFLDADDQFDLNYLKVLKELVNKEPEAGFYAVPYLIKKKSSSVLVAPIKTKSHWNYFEFVNDGGMVSSSSVVVKKNVFDSVGFFRSGFKMAEDTDMWLRIGLQYDLGFSKEIYNIWDFTIESSATKTLAPPIDSPILLTYQESINLLNNVKKKNLEKYVLRKRNDNVLKFLQLGMKKEALETIIEAENMLDSKVFYWPIIKYTPTPLCKILYYLIMINLRILKRFKLNQ